MSRYVDADAIKGKAWKVESEACFYALEDVVSVTDIDNAPSIDIVRCRECKYHNGEYCFRLVSKDAWDVIGSQCVITMQPDDFCSYGEREK